AEHAERRNGATRRRAEVRNCGHPGIRADAVDHEVVRVVALSIDTELSGAADQHRSRRELEQTLKAPAIQRQLVEKLPIDYRRYGANVRIHRLRANDDDGVRLASYFQKQRDGTLISHVKDEISN